MIYGIFENLMGKSFFSMLWNQIKLITIEKHVYHLFFCSAVCFPLIMAKIARCVDQYLFLNLFVFNNPLQPLFKDDIEGFFLILFFLGEGGSIQTE